MFQMAYTAYLSLSFLIAEGTYLFSQLYQDAKKWNPISVKRPLDLNRSDYPPLPERLDNDVGKMT